MCYAKSKQSVLEEPLQCFLENTKRFLIQQLCTYRLPYRDFFLINLLGLTVNPKIPSLIL